MLCAAEASVLLPGQREPISPLLTRHHSIPERWACLFHFADAKMEVPGEEDLHCHVGVGSLAPLNALPCSAHRKTQLVSLWTEDARFAELCDASFCRGCTEKQTWGTAGLKGEE